MDDLGPSLFVLGLTSGLTSIGYSIIAVSPEGVRQPEVDVLAGTRTKGIGGIRRWNAHWLVLSVLVERHPPGIIALGPPVFSKEPEEYVQVMRQGLQFTAQLLRVPLVMFDDEGEMVKLLMDQGVTRKRGPLPGLSSLVQHHLGKQQSQDKRCIMATASALAGCRKYRQQQQENAWSP